MLSKIAEVRLVSARLWLRPYQETDTEPFYKIIQKNKQRLAPVFPGRVRQVTSLDQARRFVLQFKADWLLGKIFAFGVWRQDTAQYIGDISLRNTDKSIPKAEIGYYLDANAEGKGYGAEMLETIIRFAFEVIHLNKIFIRTSLHNVRSHALAERCGFLREGLIRQDFCDDKKQLVDIFYYGLTRSDYENKAGLKKKL
jgi:RimJ/RimL family protein N-acetyltransferase